MKRVFHYESVISAPADVVFEFHERPDALRLLLPPGLPIKILEHTGGIGNGARVVLRMGIWPIYLTWLARHEGYIAGRQFRDVQESGPFRTWEHTHIVQPLTETTSILQDHIEYDFGVWGLLDSVITLQLKKTFAYRHRVTARLTTIG